MIGRLVQGICGIAATIFSLCVLFVLVAWAMALGNALYSGVVSLTTPVYGFLATAVAPYWFELLLSGWVAVAAGGIAKAQTSGRLRKFVIFLICCTIALIIISLVLKHG